MSLPPVLFVIQQSGASANGGIKSITEVMLRLRHHRPIVVTNLESPQTEAWRGSGLPVHVIPETASRGLATNPFGTIASYRRYYRKLIELMRDTGARIVHANDPLAFQLALPPVKRLRNARIVLNLRDTIDPGRAPPRLRYFLSFAAADHVLFLSRDMARRWRGVASNAERACSITYSIVDRSRYAPRPWPETGRPVVLLTGIIRPKKGQLEFLTNVAPALVSAGVEIWLAGDFDPSANPYMAACAQAAPPLGDGVKFLGYRSDLPELIGRSTVVAVASRHEGLVRAMIEAMACARPVVSFDVCSAREILEQKAEGAGIVVEQGDHAGMAKAILHYCTNPESARRAGSIGTEVAGILFDADEVVERYELAYQTVAGRRDPGPPGLPAEIVHG